MARLAENPPTEVQALVLISAPIVDTENDLKHLAELAVPVMDLFAENDIADVTDAAPAKRRAAIDLPGYSQRTVPGAMAGYERTADNLVAQVRAWLAAHADGRKSPR